MPIEIGPTRPVNGARDAQISPARPRLGSAPSAAATAPVIQSDARDAGAAPIDAERVAVIRKAIAEGRYPVVPAQVADAMIAAGLLLRSGQ